MAEALHMIIGTGIIILNIIPFALKKQKYIFLTILVSLLMLFLLALFQR